MPEQVNVNNVKTELDEPLPPAAYKYVMIDLDTTGRRLMDEICHIGAVAIEKDGVKSDGDQSSQQTDLKANSVDQVFSQYVMPYRNPNQGARRSFGITVVNVGKYRMLKNYHADKILKTKSEISALQDFLSWLEKVNSGCDGVVLVYHEQDKVVLSPLIIQALEKYNLMSNFSKLVKGFCNATHVISNVGDKSQITSLSLRSLCKTVLGDTGLSTTTAADRSNRLKDILLKMIGNGNGDIDGDKLLPYTKSIQHEQSLLTKFKFVINKQDSLRPIFSDHLNQKRQLREKALRVRRHIAEAGIDYQALKEAHAGDKMGSLLDTVQVENDEEKERMVNIVTEHFNSLNIAEKQQPTQEEEVSEVVVKSEPVEEEA